MLRTFKNLLLSFISKIYKIIRPLRVFNTYKSALSSCNKAGYEDLYLIQTIIQKNIVYRELLSKNNTQDLSIFTALFPFSLIEKSNFLNILDFGGGGGSHYEQSKTLLPKSISLNWVVVETKPMVFAAKSLSTNSLKFFYSITDAKKYLNNIDIILSNSSLPYCEDPLKILHQLINLDAKYIYITRTPLLENNQTIISVQTSNLSDNGPGPLPDGFINKKIKYPITFINKYEFETILKIKYDIKIIILEDYLTHKINNTKISRYTYFCVAK